LFDFDRFTAVVEISGVVIRQTKAERKIDSTKTGKTACRRREYRRWLVFLVDNIKTTAIYPFKQMVI
jgi:hypothetical protein